MADMNLDSVCVSLESSVRVETVSFNSIPGQSKLFLDFQAESSELMKFYPARQTPLKSFAETVLSDYQIDRQALCDALLEINQAAGAGELTLKNIEKLRDSDCVAIVTGQQAGLFSGALYTIYKALSTIKYCEDLRRQNIKVVPVFWIAEEDHDFDEIKKTYVLANALNGEKPNLFEIETTPQNLRENVAVGAIRLDETVNETLTGFLEEISKTDFTAEIKKLAAENYQPGETFSGAFTKFLARVFAPYGLIFLKPLDERLKRLCEPIFERAVEHSGQIVSALLKRNSELQEANYAAQVLVEENSFPFFLLEENGERRALRRDSATGRVKVQNSKLDFELSELKEIAAKAPQRLSPNALLRPVVQDYLLPTITYFGGAAEIAYFAQNSVVYEILQRPVTPIRHRASFTVIEPKNRRTLEKYDLSFANLFGEKERILAELVEKFLNRETAVVFAEVEEVINTQLNRLDRHLLESEPTLSDNLANRRRKILWHLGALRKKYHRAEIFKHEVFERRMETLFLSLLPHNALQERTLNVLTFLNFYGENFIEWVYNAIDTEEKGHQIIYL